MRVLITGATGLIGREITKLCHKKDIGVNYLTTSKTKLQKRPNYRGFYWNPKTREIDASCLENVDAIINLVGATVFNRWSKSYKKEILDSRVKSAELLLETMKAHGHQVQQIVSASAIGIYPSSLQKLYFEDEPQKSQNFLGEVVEKWESAIDRFNQLEIKVSKIRIGLVLSNKGGAFPKLKKAAEYKMGAAFGKGDQWQSWIHIHDLAKMFLFVLENKLEGVYNGVAPNPVTGNSLNRKLAKSLNKERWIKNIPSPVLKFAMGNMSSLVLESQLVSSDKIEAEGFRFKYKNIKKAFQDLI